MHRSKLCTRVAEMLQVSGQLRIAWGWPGRCGFASARAASPGDLLGAVAQRPEDPVALRALWAAKEWFAKEGIDVFPDDLSPAGHFKQSPEGRLGDQRIAVRQSLSEAHARREEIPS